MESMEQNDHFIPDGSMFTDINSHRLLGSFLQSWWKKFTKEA